MRLILLGLLSRNIEKLLHIHLLSLFPLHLWRKGNIIVVAGRFREKIVARGFIMHSDLIHQLQAIVDSSADKDSNRTIARFMLSHLMTLDTLSVQTIAGACFASIATVSRFVRSLGFESFAQLKQAAVHYRHSINSSAQDYLQELPYEGDDQQTVIQYTRGLTGAMEDFSRSVSIEQIDRVARKIHDAQGVALYGFFQPGLLAKQLQFLFLSIGRYTESYDLIEDHEERARTMQKGDLALFLSVNGNYVAGQGSAVLTLLRERGVTLVLMTQNPSPALHRAFDEVVLLGKKDSTRSGYYKLQLATELLFSRYMHLFAPKGPEQAGGK